MNDSCKNDNERYEKRPEDYLIRFLDDGGIREVLKKVHVTTEYARQAWECYKYKHYANPEFRPANCKPVQNPAGWLRTLMLKGDPIPGPWQEPLPESSLAIEVPLLPIAHDDSYLPPEPEPLSYEDKLWNDVLKQLQLQMTRATFDTWVKGSRLFSLDDEVAKISVKNEFAKDWLENRLEETVSRVLTSILGRNVNLRFVVAQAAEVG